MSFYTYYGKLKDELLVAVLPNGTVELDDPVHLYSQKRLITYPVRDVDVTDDGEDCFIFQDGYYTFEAVTSKTYKAISLTRKCRSGGEVATVALTRHYDQVQTATPASTRPKIWTGAIEFHDWAKNESFIVIAPQGLGNAKDVVAMWQWTKDAKGVAKTLSYGVSKQVSDAQTPEKFSFKQNDYYTLDCQVNTTTKGLNVTVKGPTNAAKAQNELTLAPRNEGAEHRFSPPRSRQEKISMECSLPNAKPSLPRINAALPFPSDLVETLSYSAAYVDQAGYLAKYAVKQFEKLDKSYHLLEKKAEARATKVAKLEGEVNGLTTDKQTLSKRNSDLEAQMAKERKEAAKEKADLEEDLRKALAALDNSKTLAKELARENDKLKEYIAKDKLEDIERERVHHKHEKEDHEAIDIINARLRKSEELAGKLKDELNSKNKTISELKSALDSTKGQLKTAEAEIVRLNGELASEKKQKADVQGQLDDLKHKLSVAEEDLKHLRRELAQTKTDLASEKKTSAFLAKQNKDDAKDHQDKANDLEDKIKEIQAQFDEQKTDLEKLDKAYRELEESHKEASTLRRSAEEKLKEVRTASEAKQKALEEKYVAKYKTLEARYNELREHDGDQHHTIEPVQDVKLPVVAAVEITN